MDKPLAPAGIKLRLRTIGVQDGQPSLGFGFRRDQVGKGLGLDQVELTVQERAAGELACLGVADAWKAGQRIEQSRYSCLAAMDLELGRVLAGKTVRAWEK
jgi:hypothetical protein